MTAKQTFSLMTFRIIRSPEDYIALQADVDAVGDCLDAKLLTLNAATY